MFYAYLHTLIIKVKTASQEVTDSSLSLLGFMEKISLFINDINSLTAVVINNTGRQAEIVSGTKEAIETLRSSIDKISNNVGTQASFIEENSASITEMTSNINSVNSIVKNANSLSEKLLQALRDGEEKVENTIENIRNIENSSNEMNEIINLISDIATQTNLLSMNASIEAAHAGDYGKGFAVVAEEVRKLSDDSAEKANNIAAHIKTMNAYIESGVSISENTEQALLQIKKDVEATTELLNTIYHAMEEQSAGTEEILSSTRSVVEATEDIRQLTATQKERSEQIQMMMEDFVKSEAEVKKNITNQAERYKEFTGSLDRIKENLKRNGDIARNLDQILNQFTV
jgi:methyl-accepting chemotaxis protein